MELLTPPIASIQSGTATNSTTSWSQVITISLASSTEYYVVYYAEYDINQSFRPAEIKIEFNDTTVIRKTGVPTAVTAVSQFNHFSGFFTITTGASAGQKLDLDHRMITSFGSDTITTRRAALIAYELGA